jgi:outer membrane protein
VQVSAKNTTFRTWVRTWTFAVLGQVLTSMVARADDVLRDGNTSTSGWDIALGGGAAVRPTYEGSDRYLARPAPLLSLTWTWADRVSIGPTGLSAYWHEDAFRVARSPITFARTGGSGTILFGYPF